MSNDDGFAPEELSMLRSFFRDEALEGLERVTSSMLQTTSEPSDEQMGDAMRVTHTIKGSAGTVALPQIAEFAHRLEDRFAQVHTGQIRWTATAMDCFIEAIDAFRSVIEATEMTDDLLTERLDQQLNVLDSLAKDGAEAPVVTAIAGGGPQPGDGEHRDDGAHDDNTTSDGTPRVYQGSDDSTRSIIAGGLSGPYTRPDNRRVLRVAPDRVDRLMDSAGELVFDRTRIERRVQHVRSLTRELGVTRQKLREQIVQLDDGDIDIDERTAAFRQLENQLATQVTQLSSATASLLEDTDALRRTSETLQDGLTQIRMQTAGSLLHRLAPTLRSIARAADKKIELTTAGEEIEFDKAVADQVMDPIIQLLRNAVAHGIEPVAQRLSLGKPAAGQIRIEARQEPGVVVLTVQDDGVGIDPAALRRRFVQSERWTQTKADLASDEDVLRSIFDAGVSTRDEADELAGRGVGLDAARASIARLGGEIEMTSTPGKGTLFTMRLPVTTAVAQAMLFKVHGNVYALPNLHVLDTTYVELASGTAPATITVHKELVPLLCMQHVLGSQIRNDRTGVPAIVVDYAGKRFALTCDKIVGARQIVVKQLGPLLSPLTLYSGATISGSGKVQLILDTAALIHLAYPDSQPVQRPTNDSAPDQPEKVSGRALVADDSRAIREVMTRILSRAGYIVDVADNGARALGMFRELRYDILLTDLEMPQLDGFGLIESVRQDDNETPIIIVSSRATSANKRRAHRLGVLTFVAKPVTRRKIIDALARMS